MTLAPGRLPILRAHEIPRRAYLRFRGPIYLQNTKHGARIMIAVDVVAGLFDTLDVETLAIKPDPNELICSREWFMDFRSPSYVRLCKRFGDDVSQWFAGSLVFVQQVITKADGRPRVEVIA